MANVGSLNNYISLGAADQLYSIKTALLAAGWDVLATSDGTNYRYNSGSPLNPSGTGPLSTQDNLNSPANWNNNSAWCRLREPGGAYNAISNPLSGREYVFMRGSGVNATSVVIKYSRATGFIVEAPTNPNVTLPTTGVGGDGVVWLASGSIGFGSESSVTTAASAVSWAGASGYVSTVASNTAVNGVYGWWSFRVGIGGASNTGLITYTEGAQFSPATYPTQDQDPSFRQYAGAFDFWSSFPAVPYVPQFWQCYDFTAPINPYRVYATSGYVGLPGALNGALTAWSYSYPRAGIGNLPYGANPVYHYPVLIGTTVTFPKGFTTGIKCFNVQASMMDTFSGSDPRIAIYTSSVANFTMPWVSGQLPLY